MGNCSAAPSTDADDGEKPHRAEGQKRAEEWTAAFILKQQYDECEQVELLDRVAQARKDAAYAAALEYADVDPVGSVFL